MFRIPRLPPKLLSPSAELAIACLLAAVLAGLLWLASRKRVASDGLPRCGNCRYVVRGIASLTCPECGLDLREVGISVSRRRPLSARFLLMSWLFVFVPFTICFWAFASRYFPGPLNTVEHYRDFSCRYVHAWKKPYEGFTIVGKGSFRSVDNKRYGPGFQPMHTPPPINEVTLILRTQSGEERSLTVVGKNLRIRARDGALERTSLTSGKILDQLESIGLDARDEARRSEANAVFQLTSDILVNNQMPGRIDQFGGFGWGNVNSSTKIIDIGVSAWPMTVQSSLIGLYVAGAGYIWWSTRSRRDSIEVRVPADHAA